mgnify:CR=1 FL=1
MAVQYKTVIETKMQKAITLDNQFSSNSHSLHFFNSNIYEYGDTLYDIVQRLEEPIFFIQMRDQQVNIFKKVEMTQEEIEADLRLKRLMEAEKAAKTMDKAPAYAYQYYTSGTASNWGEVSALYSRNVRQSLRTRQ